MNCSLSFCVALPANALKFFIDYSRDVAVPVVFLTHLFWPSQSLWYDNIANSSWDLTIFIKSYWLELLPPENIPNVIMNIRMVTAILIELVWSFLCLPICCYSKIKCCFFPLSFVCSKNRFGAQTSFSSDWHFLKNVSCWFSRILIVKFLFGMSILLLVSSISAKMFLSGKVSSNILVCNFQVWYITSHCSW